MPEAQQWTSVSTRPEIIDQLVEGVDRYNPANASILEDYLYHQVREREYDCLANLAILKLYQFNTDLYNPDVIVNVLLKALTASPSPDFNLCVALLGERQNIPLSDNEPDPLAPLLPSLTHLSTLLQTCRFPAFWATFRSDEFSPLRENYTVEMNGFEDSVREVVVRAVKAAFVTISQERLSTYLDLKDEALEAFVTASNWTMDSSTGVVAVPANPDNRIQATVTRESLALPQLQKLIAHAAVA